jgi:hypothetical protein
VLRGGALLLGADLVKDPACCTPPTTTRKGVTAAFNLNLLARANRELGANFVLSQFAHYAFYNAPLQRIEMHLVSRVRQSVVAGGERFELDEGESLHTENSYKFTVDGLRALAAAPASSRGRCGPIRERLFSVHWLAPSSEGKHESNLERRHHRRKRRHRGGRRQPLLPDEFAQPRLRDLQQPQDQLPLEGQASYYSLMVNGELNTDAAWYYADPKPEAEDGQGPRGVLEGREGQREVTTAAFG